MNIEELKVAILQYAEQIASEYQESEANIPIQIDHEDFLIDLKVDVVISNFIEERDTNSVSYNVEIFCVDYTKTGDNEIDLMLATDIYLESLYKD
jgi:hypothetical protein